MSAELVHTSVPRGLRGDSGFATAVATRALPRGLEAVFVELSGYDHDANRSVGSDRVDWAHRIVTLGGKSFTVLSRTAPCGSDDSGRPNRIAHHILVELAERAVAGPAWMIESFKGFVTTVPAIEERAIGPQLPVGDVAPRRALAWEAAGFDPGWAGIVARTLLDARESICYVILPSELDTLPLVSDVLALLPVERRWLATFSTRWQRTPAAAKCQLRFVRAGATGLQKLLHEPGVRHVVIEPGIAADSSDAAQAAREGRKVESSLKPVPSTRVHPVLAATAQVDEAATERSSNAPPPPRFQDLQASTAELSFDAADAFVKSPTAAATVVASSPSFNLVIPASPSLLAAFSPLAILLFAYSAIALVIAATLFALS